MKWCMDSNRPLPSSKNPHFQNEAKCTTFLVKMSFIYFLNVLYFSFDWLCHFKRLFIPVWREIHRSKILPVTSWQLTNRIVIFHAPPDTAYVNHFFPSEFIIWFKSIQYFGARTQGYAELREPIKTFENYGYLLIGNLVLLLVPLSRFVGTSRTERTLGTRLLIW